VTTTWPFAGSLLAGSVCSTGPWPYILHARCCDLRRRFLVKPSLAPSGAKGKRGSTYRAIARNGRILLCADRPLEELPGRLIRLRLQTWHRVYLPGETPQPHGILLCMRGIPDEDTITPVFEMRLRPLAEATGELHIEVGGRMVLDFFLATTRKGSRNPFPFGCG